MLFLSSQFIKSRIFDLYIIHSLFRICCIAVEWRYAFYGLLIIVELMGMRWSFIYQNRRYMCSCRRLLLSACHCIFMLRFVGIFSSAILIACFSTFLSLNVHSQICTYQLRWSLCLCSSSDSKFPVSWVYSLCTNPNNQYARN